MIRLEPNDTDNIGNDIDFFLKGTVDPFPQNMYIPNKRHSVAKLQNDA